MSHLLAFDTSTETCSVALLAGERLLAARQVTRASGFGGHSEHVLQLVAEVLAEARLGLADCEAIAFGAGPGAFTGLRVACSVAQGLALGLGCSVVGVDCLAAIGLGAALEFDQSARHVLVVQDARMGEVYLETIELQADQRVVGAVPSLVAPSFDAFESASFDLVCGSGVRLYPELSRLGVMAPGFEVPQAYAIGLIGQQRLAEGQGTDASLAAPLYVRDRVALTIAERQAGAKLPA